jgi:Fe-Mn family superoxide dismutase
MAHHHEKRSFPLEGKLQGISDNQLQQHRDVLYAGYVTKLNEIEAVLAEADRSKANATYSAYGEAKREEVFAYNASVLHEMYFENLGGKGGSPVGLMAELVTRDFGSIEKWQEDFRACGMAARGWTILAYSMWDKRLHNYLLDAHHQNVPIAVLPLLVLDVYEHAYTIDYGVKRPPYLDAYLKNIDWDVVNKRAERIGQLD